jgi:nucleoside-diphosphate-sugar epimerase
MNILVTGNLGYLGSLLTKMLKELGHEVDGLDNGMQRATLLDEDGACKPQRQYYDVVELSSAKWYDVIYHLAAISNDPMGNVSEKLTMDTNVKLVADVADRYPDARQVLASSASVYGLIDSDKIATERFPLGPLTYYAISKVEAEKLVSSYWDYSILRMGTLWGDSPNFRRDIVVNAFVYEAYHTGTIRPKSDARRPMLHVYDAARAMVIAGSSGLWTNKLVNVATENTTVSQIAKAVAEVCEVPVWWDDSISPDKRDYAMDVSRFESISGDMGRVLRVGDPGATRDILSKVKILGKSVPTRLERLKRWLDMEPDIV